MDPIEDAIKSHKHSAIVDRYFDFFNYLYPMVINLNCPATSGTIYCNAGDTIEIRANSFGITSPSIVGGAAENFFIIERLGGIM